jgi:hypothetical protein
MPAKSRGSKKALFSSAAKPKPSKPPAPFTVPPESLKEFVDELDKDHIYITSIDDQFTRFKQKIFAVPLVLNVLLGAILVYRIFTIIPYYLSVAGGTEGFTREIIIARFKSFAVDFFLYSFVFPWPKEFFIDGVHGSPLHWRRSIGFRRKEVVVRRSRAWEKEVLGSGVDVVTEKQSEQRRTFEEAIASATSHETMHDKTGYALLNRAWYLDWALMVGAHELIDSNTTTIDDFMTQTFVYSPTYGWVIYQHSAAAGSSIEEKQRQKIIAFKDTLTEMGKENLFFQWVELVQVETTKPEGFTREGQQELMRKAKILFEDQGVDFDAFWKRIGGAAGMPGMEPR